MEQKKIVAEAFNDMAPNYEAIVDGELQRFWGWRYDDFVDTVINRLPKNTTGAILDVATGTAVIPRKLMARNFDFKHIFGIDLTMGMLKSGAKKVHATGNSDIISLTNGNAMQMPYQNNTFATLVCGLATHHMDIHVMLAEMNRIIQPGGRLLLADVGSGKLWKNPIYRLLLKISTLIYFTIVEGYSRAKAEMSAIPNVHTQDEWKDILQKHGFTDIKITKLWRRYFWIPSPLIIEAFKNSDTK